MTLPNRYAQSEGLPYSYALLDSWWYYKGQARAQHGAHHGGHALSTAPTLA